MSTAVAEATDQKTHAYKIGERIDVSVDFSINDLGVDELNEKLYSKAINEEQWKEEVTKRLATKGLNYGEFDAVISNSGLDRHGERIILEGIDTSHMRANAPMPWSHEYANLPLGKWIKIWKSGGNLMGRGRMDHDIFDFADIAYKMLLRGTLNAISIGGLIKELDTADYSIIKKMEMVEASVVVVGAHPDALIVSRSLNMKETEFKSAYEKYLAEAVVDKYKTMGEDDISKAISVLKQLVATLEDAAKPTSSVGDDAKPELAKQIKRIRIKDNAKSVIKEAERVIRIVKLKQ